jgi:hypothetical protein
LVRTHGEIARGDDTWLHRGEGHRRFHALAGAHVFHGTFCHPDVVDHLFVTGLATAKNQDTAEANRGDIPECVHSTTLGPKVATPVMGKVTIGVLVDAVPGY